MRENRTYGSEGGETGTTGLPYPYLSAAPTGLNGWDALPCRAHGAFGAGVSPGPGGGC